MKKLIARLARDISGATGIEYGFIAGGIFIAIITVVSEVGTELGSIFTAVKSSF